jgi:small nuclear ribonucleoprotein (snRNP)-like protein
MKSDRPFDSLVSCIGNQITIQTKDGVTYAGDLVSFDIHLNVVLDNVFENSNSLEGKVLIRGDTISIVKHI